MGATLWVSGMKMTKLVSSVVILVHRDVRLRQSSLGYTQNLVKVCCKVVVYCRVQT